MLGVPGQRSEVDLERWHGGAVGSAGSSSERTARPSRGPARETATDGAGPRRARPDHRWWSPPGATHPGQGCTSHAVQVGALQPRERAAGLRLDQEEGPAHVRPRPPGGHRGRKRAPSRWSAAPAPGPYVPEPARRSSRHQPFPIRAEHDADEALDRQIAHPPRVAQPPDLGTGLAMAAGRQPFPVGADRDRAAVIQRPDVKGLLGVQDMGHRSSASATIRPDRSWSIPRISPASGVDAVARCGIPLRPRWIGHRQTPIGPVVSKSPEVSILLDEAYPIGKKASSTPRARSHRHAQASPHGQNPAVGADQRGAYRIGRLAGCARLRYSRAGRPGTE